MSLSLSHFGDKTIAISGLKTGDNPQPGPAVIRSLRDAGFTGKIIGLVYDAYEAGIYAPGLADEIYQMPFPSIGSDAFLRRIDHIQSKSPIDVIIPTLDSEIISYIRLENKLTERGIKFYLPDENMLLMRQKAKLWEIFNEHKINVPETVFINDEVPLHHIPFEYPYFLKGNLYEAYKIESIDQALLRFRQIRDKWGLPVLAQKMVLGDEFNVSLVGDGSGDILGMIPQRKIIITDKGKGFGGVVVDNPALNQFTEKVIKILNWKGPCELELIQSVDGEMHLLEINPRFPAWIYLAQGAGQNLPAMLVKLALGESVEKLTEYKTGTIFIRHSQDYISHISVMGQIATDGELIINDRDKQ